MPMRCSAARAAGMVRMATMMLFAARAQKRTKRLSLSSALRGVPAASSAFIPMDLLSSSSSSSSRVEDAQEGLRGLAA